MTSQLKATDYRFCVAPMMDWTDRHCRVFHRQLTRRARLYTEMLTTGAIVHGDREHLIGFSAVEHPVALQIGGCDPRELAEAALIGEATGYDEINLNCGCPSDRVKSGRFGACLMAEPDTVARGVEAMVQAVSVPVTVKCRIAIDEQDPEDALPRFVDTVASAGCSTFLVHARKAWLQGLSPRQNREVPPLDYGCVYRLKQSRPDLTIVINGGVETLAQAQAHLAHIDGVMLGRAAYRRPWVLADVDRLVFDDAAGEDLSREDIAMRMLPYIEAVMARGLPPSCVTRHMLGLFHGCPGGRIWRRILSEQGRRSGAGMQALLDALDAVRDAAAGFDARLRSIAAQ